MTPPPKVWDDVLRRLEGELPPSVIGAWLRDLKVEEDPDRGIRLTCPSDFHKARIQNRWLELIRRTASTVTQSEVTVELVADRKKSPKAPQLVAEPAAKEPRLEKSKATPSRHRSAPAAAETPEELDSLTFDNFVVGPCNSLAREASLAMVRAETRSLRQLYLSAASGLGKTHLCRAVLAEARRQGHRKILYTSAENFTSEFTTSLHSRETSRFKQRYRRECEMLIVEDVQFLQGKTATQLELFHTLQHLLDAGRQVVVTGDRLPRELTGLDERIRSQLAGGLVAPLEDPSATVRRRILRAKAAHGGVHVPPDCLDMLVESVSGSVRDLEGALVQVVTTASLLKRRIDKELTRQALQTKTELQAKSRKHDPRHVIATVARFFQTSPEAMASRSRRRDVLVPRQLAMYLCHRYSDASLAEIGREMGRDHPAVSNAIKRVEREILERAPLRYKVEALCDRLRENSD